MRIRYGSLRAKVIEFCIFGFIIIISPQKSIAGHSGGVPHIRGFGTMTMLVQCIQVGHQSLVGIFYFENVYHMLFQQSPCHSTQSLAQARSSLTRRKCMKRDEVKEVYQNGVVRRLSLPGIQYTYIDIQQSYHAINSIEDDQINYSKQNSGNK